MPDSESTADDPPTTNPHQLALKANHAAYLMALIADTCADLLAKHEPELTEEHPEIRKLLEGIRSDAKDDAWTLRYATTTATLGSSLPTLTRAKTDKATRLRVFLDRMRDRARSRRALRKQKGIQEAQKPRLKATA